MSDWQVEPLTDTPEGNLRYKADNSGVERVNPADEDGRPALAGPIPRYGHKGQRGIGGTMVEASMDGHSAHGGSVQKHELQLTPEEMLRQADAMEQDYLKRTAEAKMDHGSAVDPVLVRSGFVGKEPPPWLQAYMSDPGALGGHQVGVGLDTAKLATYKTERERLRELRQQQRAQGLK